MVKKSGSGYKVERNCVRQQNGSPRVRPGHKTTKCRQLNSQTMEALMVNPLSATLCLTLLVRCILMKLICVE